MAETTDKTIVEKMEIPFTPFDNKVLIKPLEIVKLKKEFTELDDKSNKSKKKGPNGEVMDTKKTTKEVEANVRKGVVLALPKALKAEEERFPVEVGDTILYYDRPQLPTFDLYRDSILLNRYDLLGKWDITKERDSDIYGKVDNKTKGETK